MHLVCTLLIRLKSEGINSAFIFDANVIDSEVGLNRNQAAVTGRFMTGEIRKRSPSR